MLLSLSDNRYQIFINHTFKEALLITNQYPFRKICNLDYGKSNNELIEQGEAEYLLRNLKNKELKPVTFNEFYDIT